ncbi:MAG: hypothetical protein M0T69_02045 [Deltaproteobacteria bacterium]|nr:hypothetical protein [Deltaproteobacteria bacterium]
MGDNELKPYRVVREIGQGNLEAECCRLIALGYEPIGGMIVMEVVHPITHQSGMGFMQAMYRPERIEITGVERAPFKPC